jgi:hypothetical protein
MNETWIIEGAYLYPIWWLVVNSCFVYFILFVMLNRCSCSHTFVWLCLFHTTLNGCSAFRQDYKLFQLWVSKFVIRWWFRFMLADAVSDVLQRSVSRLLQLRNLFYGFTCWFVTSGLFDASLTIYTNWLKRMFPCSISALVIKMPHPNHNSSLSIFFLLILLQGILCVQDCKSERIMLNNSLSFTQFEFCFNYLCCTGIDQFGGQILDVYISLEYSEPEYVLCSWYC